MTNINCSKECKFQKDGFCCYDDTTVIVRNSVQASEEGAVCAYRVKPEKKN